MKRPFFAAIAAALLVGLVAAPAAARPPAAVPAPTIASTAVAADDFNALVAALDCVGLVGAVASPRDNLTVFAPTDQAFAELLAGGDLDLLNAVLADEAACSIIVGIIEDAFPGADGAELLETVLLYHVAPGRYPLGRVLNTASLSTLSGLSIDVGGTFAGDDAVGLVATNIQTSNGVIHVIDAVLLP